MNTKFPKTELLLKNSKPIDKLKIEDALLIMVEEHKEAAIIVKNQIDKIKNIINRIYKHLISHSKGRIIYTGCGTSGRIAMQDGVELYPTFNWPKERVDFLIGGGKRAILSSVENAEDDISQAEKDFSLIKPNNNDILIGIAASGNTPYTCSILEKGLLNNCLTVSISNNLEGEILKFGKLNVVLDTKEEVVAGSTRLKAGTAQKICLNLISTMLMVKMGRVENGLMTNLVPTNKKLFKRLELINKHLKK